MAYVPFDVYLQVLIIEKIDESLASLSYELSLSLDYGTCNDLVAKKIRELRAIRDYLVNLPEEYNSNTVESLWTRAAAIGGFTHRDMAELWQTITL